MYRIKSHRLLPHPGAKTPRAMIDHANRLTASTRALSAAMTYARRTCRGKKKAAVRARERRLSSRGTVRMRGLAGDPRIPEVRESRVVRVGRTTGERRGREDEDTAEAVQPRARRYDESCHTRGAARDTTRLPRVVSGTGRSASAASIRATRPSGRGRGRSARRARARYLGGHSSGNTAWRKHLRAPALRTKKMACYEITSMTTVSSPVLASSPLSTECNRVHYSRPAARVRSPRDGSIRIDTRARHGGASARGRAIGRCHRRPSRIWKFTPRNLYFAARFAL